LGDSTKKPGGEGEDLLSKLFEEEMKPHTKSKGKASDNFGGSTHSGAENDKTESIQRSALSNAFDVPTGELRKADDSSDFSKTEFLHKEKDEDATEFQFTDEPLSDEKISFFDVPKAESATELQEAPVRAIPDSELPGSQAGLDAIEEALNDFQEPARDFAEVADVVEEDSEEPLTLEAPSEISRSDFKADEFRQKSEVKAEDFAEIFSNDPIQVADVQSPKRKTNRAKLVKVALGLVAASVVLGGISYVLSVFKSETGIAGYRLDGFSILRAYRPPSSEESEAFAVVFKESQRALINDNPQDLISVHGKLRSILENDVRNVEAVSRMLDHAANLILWYGTASEWAQKYEEHLLAIDQISKQTTEFVDTLIIERAKARKAGNLGDRSAARSELEKALARFNVSDYLSFLLLAELSFELGDVKASEKWLNQVSDRSNRRTRFLKGLISNDLGELKSLGVEGYLPAKVMAFVVLPIPAGAQSLSERLSMAEKLFADSKDFPNLQNRLKSGKADLHQAAGESQKARELWKSILAQFPKETSVALKLASSFEEDALWDEAIAAYQAMERAGGLNENSYERYAELLRVRGRQLDAGAIITKGLEKYPKSANLFYIQGRVAFDLYQIDPSKEAFNKALAAEPKFELATLGLVDIAMQRKEYVEAAALLKGIGKSSRHYAVALVSLGRLDLMKGSLDSAEDFFLSAIMADPKLESVYPQITQIQLQQERDSDAEKALATGVKALPKSPYVKMSQARVLQFQRRYDEAISKIEAIRKSHDHLLPIRFLEVDLLIDSKDFKRATDEISAMNLKEIRDPELSYLKAKLFYWDTSGLSRDVNSGEILLKYLESAVRQNPDSDKYKLMMARVATRLQDRQTATEQVDAVIKVNPKNAEAWTVLGELQMDGGNYEAASKSFKQALQLTRFRSELYGKLAECFKQLSQPALAIEFYRKVLAERPQDAEAHLELGKLYNQEGRFQGAVATLKKAIALRPKLSEAYYFLGFIQKELGDSRGALRSFETFLSLVPSGSESATIRDEVYFLKNGRSDN